jgi:hypothetical protein
MVRMAGLYLKTLLDKKSAVGKAGFEMVHRTLEIPAEKTTPGRFLPICRKV